MVTFMYKHTHTQNKKKMQCKKKKKKKKKPTNKQTPPPPEKKKIRVLIESVTGCKDSIPIFLFEEKKRGI